jgi:beta-glucosidase
MKGTVMKKISIVSMSVLVLVGCAAVFGQSNDFATSGKVVDAKGQPIPMATASYANVAKRLSWDFSKNNGNFGPSATSINRSPSVFSTGLAANSRISIEIVAMSGKTITSQVFEKIESGNFSLKPLVSKLPQSVYVMKIKAGSSVTYRKFMNSGSIGPMIVVDRSLPSSSPINLGKKCAAIDSVRVGKTGFIAKTVAIDAYDSDVGTIALDSAGIEAKVSALLAQMNNDEKLGQLAMPFSGIGAQGGANARIGSIFQGNGGFSGYNPASLSDLVDNFNNAMMATPRKIPIMLVYDGVHGMCVMGGGTILPHNTGMGAIQDSSVVEKGFRVAALEMRGTGATWTYAPCIAVIRDDRWGRAYEGFSESPDLTVKMARWAVLGMQTSDLSHPGCVATTTKHFAGDGGTTSGVNPGSTQGDDATLRAIHLPGYVSAIAAGTASIMPSKSNWNGVDMHHNTELLRNWLKNGTNGGPRFDGFVVSDWGNAGNQATMSAGVDVPMIPTSDAASIKNTMNGNSYVDDACKRVLRIKYRMNLFNKYLTNRQLTPTVGSALHRDAVRACVRQSLVLLKNDNTALPIPVSSNIAVWGNGGNNVGLQCGGWTVVGSGGSTILKGFQDNGKGTITYSADGSNSGNATYVVAVLSEDGYTETNFSHISLTQSPANGGNAAVIGRLAAAKASGKKVIVVLMAGRVLDISPVINNCDAFVWASLPGSEGNGVAEVMLRVKPEYNFTGKLPVTWPMDLSAEPINVGDGKTTQAQGCRYAFGYGLSY